MFIIEVCLLMAFFLATFLIVDTMATAFFPVQEDRSMRVLRSVRQDWLNVFVPRESLIWGM